MAILKLIGSFDAGCRNVIHRNSCYGLTHTGTEKTVSKTLTVVRNVWSAASASDASREHYPKAVQVNITAALDSDSAGMSKRAICAGLPFDTSCSSSCLCTNLLLALEPIKCCPLTQNELEPTGWLVLFCLTLARLTHVSVRLFGAVVKRGSGQDARLQVPSRWFEAPRSLHATCKDVF